MGNQGLDRAIEIAGSVTALAKYLGVSKGAVSQWKAEGRNVPLKHCPRIERFTDRQVLCEQLSDEVSEDDWAYVRDTPAALKRRRSTDKNK